MKQIAARTTMTLSPLKLATAGALGLTLGIGWAVAAPMPAFASSYERTFRSDEVYEHVTSYREDDVYTLTSSKDGYARFELEITDDVEIDSTDYLKYDLYLNGRHYRSFSLKARGKTDWTNRFRIGPGQKAELRVSANYYTPAISYKIRVLKYTPDGLEAEPNDSKGDANEVLPGKSRYGILSSSDVDFYVCQAKRDGVYSLSLDYSPDTSLESRIIPTVMVDDDNRKTLDNFKAESPSQIAQEPLVKGQSLFIGLRNGYGIVEPFYKISVSCKEITTPQVKSLSSKRGALAMKIAKTGKNSSGYQLRWSTSKSMKDAKTKRIASGKTSITLKHLKRKKCYYVQARAYYVDYDSATGWNKQYHYFTWSKAKSATTR